MHPGCFLPDINERNDMLVHAVFTGVAISAVEHIKVAGNPSQ